MGQIWPVPYGATGKDAFVPTVDAVFTGPNGENIKHRVKVDGGADRSIFPIAWMDVLGIAPDQCFAGHVITASGPVPDGLVRDCREEVLVEMDDAENGVVHAFKLHPLFMDGLYRPLFGRDDFFEHFIVTIDHVERMMFLETRGN